MTIVTITDQSTRITHRARVREADPEAAAARAIRGRYGRSAYLWSDNIRADSDGWTRYGVIMRPCRSGGSECVTGRVRVDVDSQ